MSTVVTDTECIHRSTGEEPIPFVHALMHGGDEHFFVAGQAEAGIRLKHRLRKTGAAGEADRARKVSAATDSVKAKVAAQGTEHYGRLSEVRTMIDQALLDFKTGKYFLVCQRTEKMVIDVMETGTVEAQDRPVRSIVSLAIWAVVGNTLDERVVSGHTQKAAMKAVMLSSIIKGLFDA